MSNTSRFQNETPRDVPVRVEGAHVRTDRRDDLEALLGHLHNRRSHVRLSTWDRLRHAPEIADYLRRRSRVYRNLSGAAGTEGPLPFALGFFRITSDATLVPVANTFPDPKPELIVRVLSEFVEPGARFFFGGGAEEGGWEVQGEDEICTVKKIPRD